MKLGLTWEPAVHKRVKAVILYLAESDGAYRDAGEPAVNARPAACPLVDGDAAIERLDTIAQAGESDVPRGRRSISTSNVSTPSASTTLTVASDPRDANDSASTQVQ